MGIVNYAEKCCVIFFLGYVKYVTSFLRLLIKNNKKNSFNTY